MEEMKIDIPDGYELDKENSTSRCIKLRKRLTYKSVAEELFAGKEVFYMNYHGNPSYKEEEFNNDDPNNCLSYKQATKLAALNKLFNVAKYLNKGWKPCFNLSEQSKYVIGIDSSNEIKVVTTYINSGVPCFKSPELITKAIMILGEHTIRQALTKDY